MSAIYQISKSKYVINAVKQKADLNVKSIDYSYYTIFGQQDEQRIVYINKKERTEHTHIWLFLHNKNEKCKLLNVWI